MLRKTLTLVSTLVASALASAMACNTGGPSQPATQPPPDAAAMPFEPEPPSVYVAKVKGILVGLPPTDDEVKAVVADPAQLKPLIDGWMKLPQYHQKMTRFFQLAFQQTQISSADFADQTFPRPVAANGTTTPLLVQNAQESFARTVLQLIAEQRPFTESITTRRFMMTTAMMELYSFLDVWHVDDAGKVVDRYRAAHPGYTISVGAAQGAIPIGESADPASPNFLHWYDPDVATANAAIPGCQQDPIVYPYRSDTLHLLLYGTLDGHKSAAGTQCLQFGGTAKGPQLVASDFNDWRMVTIRTPTGAEASTTFYDLGALRSASELVLVTPRIGFFSTPAFFANWQTNISNQMRVTINQALIVATGSAVDGTDPTKPATTPGLDPAHAAPGSACFGCHKTLDPLRSIFASTYSWNYHDQTDPALTAQKGLFAYRGMTMNITGIGDLATALSTHPLFAPAWAQKLCYYVNSTACDAEDPELLRVVEVFRSSGYSWNALVRELLASPLTTNASETKTSSTVGEVVAVSRRDHLCAALNARLGFTDVCGLDVITKRLSQTTIPEIVSGLPSDGYGRGSTAPVLPNLPTLFFRAATENICAAVAAQVIDAPAKPGLKQWASAQPDAAIAELVQLVMALTPSDPRSAAAQALLKSHFTDATQAGKSASDALKSTFIAACLAPSAVSIGL